MTAARIRKTSLERDARNAWAVPWKLPWTLSGRPSSALAFSIARTAWPSDTLGARLREAVATGNCPWWFTDRGALDVWTCVNAPSGTDRPPADVRDTLFRWSRRPGQVGWDCS